MLLSIKKHKDTLNEQTKTRPQKPFEFKFTRPTVTFPFSPLVSLSVEEKWVLVVTSFEATISVFNITYGNKK